MRAGAGCPQPASAHTKPSSATPRRNRATRRPAPRGENAIGRNRALTRALSRPASSCFNRSSIALGNRRSRSAWLSRVVQGSQRRHHARVVLAGHGARPRAGRHRRRSGGTSAASRAALGRALDDILGSAGGSNAALVVEDRPNTPVVLAHRPRTLRILASNTKLFTTATGPARFGSDIAQTLRRILMPSDNYLAQQLSNRLGNGSPSKGAQSAMTYVQAARTRSRMGRIPSGSCRCTGCREGLAVSAAPPMLYACRARQPDAAKASVADNLDRPR